MCQECYSNDSRVTPLRKAQECLSNHTQYICATCGRCICIEKDSVRGLQRWNFPFQSLEDAKRYLRTAEVSTKRQCAIYTFMNQNQRIFYKIISAPEELQQYLKKNKDKKLNSPTPAFIGNEKIQYDSSQIRRLTQDEIKQYLKEKEAQKSL